MSPVQRWPISKKEPMYVLCKDVCKGKKSNIITKSLYIKNTAWKLHHGAGQNYNSPWNQWEYGISETSSKKR